MTRVEARRAARHGSRTVARPIARMRELDLLRFVAAMAVVLFHYSLAYLALLFVAAAVDPLLV